MNDRSASIAVINPGSSRKYTDLISRSLEPLRAASDFDIHCMSLHEGPLVIKSNDDIAAVTRPLCDAAASLPPSTRGIVIACFADPALQAVRRISSVPVVGSCEAAVMEALDYGRRPGLISTGDDVDADRALILSCGSDVELAGIECLGIPTEQIPTHPHTLARLIRCGESLEQLGADAILLGCAGMSGHAGALREVLGTPVVEPVSAAVRSVINLLHGKG